jgi:acyl-CoA synthetase (NDP forming)
VIGASSDRRKFGNRALRAYVLQGFTVLAINPNETEVEGLRTYASVLDVPGPLTWPPSTCRRTSARR